MTSVVQPSCSDRLGKGLEPHTTSGAAVIPSSVASARTAYSMRSTEIPASARWHRQRRSQRRVPGGPLRPPYSGTSCGRPCRRFPPTDRRRCRRGHGTAGCPTNRGRRPPRRGGSSSVRVTAPAPPAPRGPLNEGAATRTAGPAAVAGNANPHGVRMPDPTGRRARGWPRRLLDALVRSELAIGSSKLAEWAGVMAMTSRFATPRPEGHAWLVGACRVGGRDGDDFSARDTTTRGARVQWNDPKRVILMIELWLGLRILCAVIS